MWKKYINSKKLYENNHDEIFKKDPPPQEETEKYKTIHLAALESILKQIHLIKSLKLKKYPEKLEQGIIKTIKGYIKDLFKIFEFMFIPYDPKNEDSKKKKDEANLEIKDVKLNFMMTNNVGDTIWQIHIGKDKDKIIAPFDRFLDDLEKIMEEVKWKGMDDWHNFTLNVHTKEDGTEVQPNINPSKLEKQIDTLGDKSVPEIHNALEFQIIRYLRAHILRPSLKLIWCELENGKRRPSLRLVNTKAFGSKCGDKKGGRKTRRRRRKRKRKKTRRRRRRRR